MQFKFPTFPSPETQRSLEEVAYNRQIEIDVSKIQTRQTDGADTAHTSAEFLVDCCPKIHSRCSKT